MELVEIEDVSVLDIGIALPNKPPTILPILWLKEKNGERALPLGIDEVQAQNIEMALQEIKGGTEMPRPPTHSLMKTVINFLGGSLEKITITEMREKIYYATLALNGEEIDSRPSDAVTLAILLRAPIFVSKKLMDKLAQERIPKPGENVFFKSPKETTIKESSSHLEILNEKLAKAIKAEKFEEAAKIRDQIKKLTSHN